MENSKKNQELRNLQENPKIKIGMPNIKETQKQSY